MVNNFFNEQIFLKSLCKLFCSDYLYEPQFFSVHEFYRITENYVNQLEIAESRKPVMSWQFVVNLLGHLNRHQFLSLDRKTRMPSEEEICGFLNNELAILPPAIAWRAPYFGMSDVGIRFLEHCNPQRFVRGSLMSHEDYLAAFYPRFLETFPARMGFSNLHQWLKSGKVEVNTAMLHYQRDSRHCQLWQERNHLSCDEAEHQYRLPFMTYSDVIPFLEMCRQEGFVLDELWGYAEDPEDMDGRLSRVELFSAEEFAEYRQLFRSEAIVENTNNYLINHFQKYQPRFSQGGKNYFERFDCRVISLKQR